MRLWRLQVSRFIFVRLDGENIMVNLTDEEKKKVIECIDLRLMKLRTLISENAKNSWEFLTEFQKLSIIIGKLKIEKE